MATVPPDRCSLRWPAWTSHCLRSTDPRRAAVRGWLESHPRPTAPPAGRSRAWWPRTGPAPGASGPTRPTSSSWTKSSGGPGCSRPDNTIGIGWAGPTIVHAGSPAQQDRYLLPLLAGEEIWCQLFSEPGAGSDLASLATRAELDGDQWVVRGRRSGPRTPIAPTSASCWPAPSPRRRPHRGISYFICPMDAPGVTVRPLVDMTGTHTFNEVFLDEVRLPADEPGR